LYLVEVEVAAVAPAEARDQPHPTRLSSTIAILLVVVYFVIAAGVVALEWSIHNGPDPSLLAPVTLSAYVLIGGLIVVRRGSHPIGWILQAIGITALITGSGTQNMEDRLDALGGGVELDSAPGQGTRLRGHLPVLVGAIAQ
jgi:hypothetical protein